MLRNGTAIRALIREAEHAQSKKDFLHKINIALKEANETEYWIDLLKDSFYISEIEHFDFSQKKNKKITKTTYQYRKIHQTIFINGQLIVDNGQ